jgi:hypothetical protein
MSKVMFDILEALLLIESVSNGLCCPEVESKEAYHDPLDISSVVESHFWIGER